jgi:hypothetical protein
MEKTTIELMVIEAVRKGCTQMEGYCEDLVDVMRRSLADFFEKQKKSVASYNENNLQVELKAIQSKLLDGFRDEIENLLKQSMNDFTDEIFHFCKTEAGAIITSRIESIVAQELQKATMILIADREETLRLNELVQKSLRSTIKRNSLSIPRQ